MPFHVSLLNAVMQYFKAFEGLGFFLFLVIAPVFVFLRVSLFRLIFVRCIWHYVLRYLGSCKYPSFCFYSKPSAIFGGHFPFWSFWIVRILQCAWSVYNQLVCSWCCHLNFPFISTRLDRQISSILNHIIFFCMLLTCLSQWPSITLFMVMENIKHEKHS